MTACGRIVVTAGPTISAADIRSVVPDAEVAPPIALARRSPMTCGRVTRC